MEIWEAELSKSSDHIPPHPMLCCNHALSEFLPTGWSRAMFNECTDKGNELMGTQFVFVIEERMNF